jgi:hypothetical protein
VGINVGFINGFNDCFNLVFDNDFNVGFDGLVDGFFVGECPEKHILLDFCSTVTSMPL